MGSSGHAQHGDHRGPPVAHELERWSSCKKRPGSWKGLTWGLPPRAPATTLDLQTSPNNQQPWTRVVPTPSAWCCRPASSVHGAQKGQQHSLEETGHKLDTLQHLSAYDQWRIPLYLELGDLKWDPFIAKGLKSNWQCLSWKHSRANQRAPRHSDPPRKYSARPMYRCWSCPHHRLHFQKICPNMPRTEGSTGRV